MKLVDAILVPLDGSALAARSLGVAVWLAGRLGARVHVLNAGMPAGESVPEVDLGVSEKYRRLIEVHRVSGAPGAEILAAITRLGVGLVVMAAYGETGPSATPDPFRIVGHVTHEVMENSRAPVLALPATYEESLPWRSALVPLSGEIANDEALTFALHLAQALDLRVTVTHVAAAGMKAEAEGRGSYADASHHELAAQLNELIARACPTCSAEERRHIADLRLAHGDVARELLRLIEEVQASVLVVGWRGQFMQGHAQVLKALMARARCPVLLVRPGPRAAFRLKVGEALE